MAVDGLLGLAVYKSRPIYGMSYRWCRDFAFLSLVRLVHNNDIHSLMDFYSSCQKALFDKTNRSPKQIFYWVKTGRVQSFDRGDFGHLPYMVF